MGKEYDARPYAGDPYYAYIMKGAVWRAMCKRLAWTSIFG